MKSLQEQFAAIQGTFPNANMALGDGVHLITIPEVKLPDGWSLRTTTILFVVPNGYPYAAPDCFWATADLRLADGRMPQNAQIGNVAPGQSNPNTLWFSWHVQAWNPTNCDLVTYVKVIRKRFEERQ